MLYRFTMLFLILGLHFTAQVLINAPKAHPQRTPQSIPEAQEGTYNFVNGTDGCPLQVDLAIQCNGFVITPMKNSGSIPEEQEFCAINKKMKLKTERVDKGFRKTRTHVEQKDNWIKKNVVTEFSYQGSTISLQSEDAIILGDDNTFNWDMSRNGKGMTCLYSKSLN
ncbi:hypothetical protein ACES2L_04545 [Bdellovibrio bacteriovorus]